MDKTLTCIFCGQEYPPGTPSSQHKELCEHVAKCPAHPLATAIKYLQALYSQGPAGIGPVGELYKDNIEDFLNLLGTSLDDV